MEKESRYKKLRKQLMSRKILSLILDDFSFFGSIPFFISAIVISYFAGFMTLFSRLSYSFIISFIVVMVIKSVHYKDRPQKEEFNIFMEKMVAASFPSTHSMSVTILAILINLAYSAVWLKVISVILALLVYFQRYITKKHFFIDIVGGIFIGIAEVVFVVKVF